MCNLYYDRATAQSASDTFEATTAEFYAAISSDDRWPFSIPVYSERWKSCTCSDSNSVPMWLSPGDVCNYIDRHDRDYFIQVNPDTYERVCNLPIAERFAEYNHIRVCISKQTVEWFFIEVGQGYCNYTLTDDGSRIVAHTAYDGNLYCGPVKTHVTWGADSSSTEAHCNECMAFYNESAFSGFSATSRRSYEELMDEVRSESSALLRPTTTTPYGECSCADLSNYRPVWFAPIDLCYYANQLDDDARMELLVNLGGAYERACSLDVADQNLYELHFKICAAREFVRWLFYNTNHCGVSSEAPLVAPDGALFCARVDSPPSLPPPPALSPPPCCELTVEQAKQGRCRCAFTFDSHTDAPGTALVCA